MQPAKQKPPAWQPEEQPKKPAEVAVSGIEGTLTNFDVRVTMDEQGKHFAVCQAKRARRVPGLGGQVEFGIKVQADGIVGRVDIRSSDLGDRDTERCFAGVIQQTNFPRPHGGDANVTYTMMLEPRRGREPEAWDVQRISHLLDKRLPELRESCGIARDPGFTITAYVSRGGRVVTAGAAARDGGSPEALDCIATDLRTWKMPKPRKRMAKVSFPLTSG